MKKTTQSIDTYLQNFKQFICCQDYFENIDLICEWGYIHCTRIVLQRTGYMRAFCLFVQNILLEIVIKPFVIRENNCMK